MLVLVLAAAASAAPIAPKAVAQAQASVRIERPVAVSHQEWGKLPPSARREVVIRDENGREVLLRLIEQQ